MIILPAIATTIKKTAISKPARFSANWWRIKFVRYFRPYSTGTLSTLAVAIREWKMKFIIN